MNTNKAESDMSPQELAQLAKQKKKDNEIKKKQAAEEWKRQQALKKESEAAKPSIPVEDVKSKVPEAAPSKGAEEITANVDKQPQVEANKPVVTGAAALPQTKKSHHSHSETKMNSFISHLHPYEPLSLKQVRERYSNNQYAKSLFHPALLQIALKMNKDLLVGSSGRCLAVLNALKEVVTDFQPKEGSVFYRELSACIDEVQDFLEAFRSIPEGLKTAFKYVKKIIGYLVKSTISEEPQKKWICQQIDVFIKQKIQTVQELMILTGLDLIHENDTIMVYARSEVVENLLLTAHRKGKQFTVIVVDNTPYHEGKQLLDKLSEEGIETIYTLLSNVPYFIKKASKIFVGASSMMCNGTLVSRVGTALLGCIAHEYRTPFHVFCESYKFSEKSQLDSLASNEVTLPQLSQQHHHHNSLINLRYDLTPSDCISMVISEIGPVPPTSIHAIIREFTLNDYVGKIELPTE